MDVRPSLTQCLTEPMLQRVPCAEIRIESELDLFIHRMSRVVRACDRPVLWPVGCSRTWLLGGRVAVCFFVQSRSVHQPSPASSTFHLRCLSARAAAQPEPFIIMEDESFYVGARGRALTVEEKLELVRTTFIPEAALEQLSANEVVERASRVAHCMSPREREGMSFEMQLSHAALF